MRALALGLAASAALNLAARRLSPPPAADPVGVRLRADSAVEDGTFFGLGMRRLAADLGLTRLLVYYGTPEEAGVLEEEPGSHPWVGIDHPELSWGGGHYPEMAARAERILDIDPSFSYVAIYAGGVLAYNLNRPQEALEVLDYALKRDPANDELSQYIAALGFSRRGDKARVIAILQPMLAKPDCPTMIKNMMGTLYKDIGRRAEAVTLFRDISAHSRDDGYRRLARHMLAEMGVSLD